MEEKQQKGVKRAAIILLALFLLSAILFLYQHFAKDNPVKEDVVATTEAENKGAVQEDVSSNELEEDMDKKDESEDILSEDDEKSADIAKKFINAIYTFDGDEPNKAIEDAKKYSTDTLYAMMKDTPQTARATSEVYSREISDIAVEKPEYPSDDFISWIVKVTGDLKNKDGEVTGDDTEIYLVRLEKVEDQYKVSEYVINPNL